MSFQSPSPAVGVMAWPSVGGPSPSYAASPELRRVEGDGEAVGAAQEVVNGAGDPHALGIVGEAQVGQTVEEDA